MVNKWTMQFIHLSIVWNLFKLVPLAKCVCACECMCVCVWHGDLHLFQFSRWLFVPQLNVFSFVSFLPHPPSLSISLPLSPFLIHSHPLFGYIFIPFYPQPLAPSHQSREMSNSTSLQYPITITLTSCLNMLILQCAQKWRFSICFNEPFCFRSIFRNVLSIIFTTIRPLAWCFKCNSLRYILMSEY